MGSSWSFSAVPSTARVGRVRPRTLQRRERSVSPRFATARCMAATCLSEEKAGHLGNLSDWITVGHSNTERGHELIVP